MKHKSTRGSGFMSKRYIKKWKVEYVFSDGKIYRGFLNTFADNEKDFPKELHGSFCAWCDEKGCHGYFVLDGQTEQEAIENGQYVMTSGVRRKPVSVDYDNPLAVAFRIGAENILLNNEVIRDFQFPRFDARIEDCLKTDGTYVTSY